MGTVVPFHSMSKRYHQAKFDWTRHSLTQFLQSYKPNVHDAALEDPINWCSQDEYYTEALSLSTLTLQSIEDVLTSVPIVCRTITLHTPLYTGLHMNPWLGCVEALPTIVRYANTHDFITKFKKSSCDSSTKEVINCAMIITKHPHGSILPYGVGKHASTYLLTGDPNLYHPDADLATWAMVVVHILLQPSRPVWMREELDMIRAMHGGVYSDSKTSWSHYRELVASDDFKLALVTSAPRLPPWHACPHLNKFILAVFFVHESLTVEQMEMRRNAAILEFYGRAYRPDLMPFAFLGKFKQTEDDILRNTHMEMRPTLRETLLLFNKNLDDERFKKLPLMLVQPTQESVAISHLNLSCHKIESIFRSMCPSIPPLNHQTWLNLFHTGMNFQDSFKRNTVKDFKPDMTKLAKDLRAKFRQNVLGKSVGHVMNLYQSIMQATHEDMPMMISRDNSELFRKKYGRDLIVELKVSDYGLSKVACLCPKCPFFGKPIGVPGVNAEGQPCMSKGLNDHLTSFTDGMHKMVHQLKDQSDDEILIELINKFPFYQFHRSNLVNILAKLKMIRTPVPWFEFENQFKPLLATPPPRAHSV